MKISRQPARGAPRAGGACAICTSWPIPAAAGTYYPNSMRSTRLYMNPCLALLFPRRGNGRDQPFKPRKSACPRWTNAGTSLSKHHSVKSRMLAECLRHPAPIPTFTASGSASHASTTACKSSGAWRPIGGRSGPSVAHPLLTFGVSPACGRWKELAEAVSKAVFLGQKYSHSIHFKAAGAEGVDVVLINAKGYAQGKMVGAEGLEPSTS